MAIHDPQKVFSFTDNPLVVPPGDRLDAQFADHARALRDLRAAIEDLRRSDGALRNGTVGLDQLTPALRDLLPTATEGSAENWAYVSQVWAEYLDNNEPIPANILAMLGITGDHWSSRWWALQSRDGALAAEQAIAVWEDFNKRYLGAHDEPPALDNLGRPLETGALYFNTPASVMYVWTGTFWLDFANLSDPGGGGGGGGAPAAVVDGVSIVGAGTVPSPYAVGTVSGGTW